MYPERKFDLPELTGLSPESIKAHLGLYAGYVKNFNALAEMQADLMKNPAGNALQLAEITRRMPFEFDGMRLHEFYFNQWEGGAQLSNVTSNLAQTLAEQFGSFEEWKRQFIAIGNTRGVGWALLLYDPQSQAFHHIFVEQHHQGHFASVPIILALDVWEHAYVAQYGTGGRGQYIDACFGNYNWSVMEARFDAASK